MKKIRKYLFGILWGILLLQVSVHADVDKLKISQILQEGKDVYLYVNALNSEDQPTNESLAAEQLQVEIDKSTILPVEEAAPFNTLNHGITYIFCIDISRSVTDAEMKEIRESIADFAQQMTPYDHARIITIGTEITAICDYTQDRNALIQAANEIAVTANDTYLYKGLSYALDGQKKKVESRPQRAAIILFSDGMDDSDGATDETQVMTDVAETRVPIYVVGLKGKSQGDLTSVGNIARRSGGAVYSYNDMSIKEAVQTIGYTMTGAYRLHVTPSEQDFGRQNSEWVVSGEMAGYSIQSSIYVYSLSKENVVFATPTPTLAPTSTPAPTLEPTLEPTSEPEPTVVPEKNFMEQLSGFMQEYGIFCAAGAMIILALLILIIMLIKKKKNQNQFIIDEDTPSTDTRRRSLQGSYEETLDDESFESKIVRSLQEEADNLYDEEKTVDESDYYDDEKTIDEGRDPGLRMSFEITFDGITKTVEKSLVNELVLGRGRECDVDVVLGSMQEFRKQISRNHAFIINRPDGVYITDNSKNKLYLNGIEVNGETLLRNEDILQMGKAKVRVTMMM